MSIRVKCTTCSRDDEKRAVYKWNLVEYDPATKATRAINEWENWLETGQVDLELRGWKDEGFRRQQNVELDWKEQISYRIFQEDSQTKEKSLVYEGYERIISGLYFNYGYEEDKSFITIYAEVLDVFGDFTTCNIAPFQIFSPMKDTSVDDFLVNSQEMIETAIEQSNTGLVSMTLETTISTSNREELPETSFIDELIENPETWSSIGEKTTFENLFQNLMDTDQNYTNQEILKEGMQNMTAYLKTSTTSLKIDNTVLQRQMAFCSGSSMEIKQLVTQEAMVSALSSTNDVIENFINTSIKANFPVYEDYLSTSEAILRSVDNMLNILIPKLSPDIPETNDIYKIADQYSSEDTINAYDGLGFSPQERALFVSMSIDAYQESVNSSLEMANQTVPNVQKSILELGTVLKEITHRKQFEVEVTRPGLKTSMEKVQVDQEIDRKNLKIKFDLNTELEEDLQVSPETNNRETVCDCQNPPGDNFATSFFVPPNSIDFSTVFEKFDIIGNGAVFGTVTAIIVLYVIGLLVGRRYDKKDREKWKLFYMSDNLKTDKHVYLVTVFTGLSRNSGTTSNVSFVIASLLKDTGVRHLTDGVKKGFETGSVFTYVMTVQDSLGDLTFLNIWHDNSGKGGDASWNLIKVVVEDAHTGKRFVFFCNQWLSLDSHESSIQCTVPVATSESLQTFNFNFNENTRENVTDSHLWLSMFIRPEKSTFTRCERLSCCVTLLFLTMISNAMFYGKDEAVEQIRVGPIIFALSSIYISFVGIIMTFPIVLTISMIFKKSKWQKEAEDRDKNRENVESFLTQKKEMKFRMPPKCLYVAYVLVVLSILLSGFFVVLYSMEWGKAKSEEWLKTFFMSFLESLFIVDPIKVRFDDPFVFFPY
uniref:Polycystic kidney disease protein 1-like 2 n=1 Tax=Magallana gigas TaxID=29159 RepID=K1QYG6_MAGGI